MQNRLLRRPEVEYLTGYSRSTIYRLMPLGEFPKPVYLSERSVAWLESDIQAWIDARIENSRADKRHDCAITTLSTQHEQTNTKKKAIKPQKRNLKYKADQIQSKFRESRHGS